MSYWKTKVVPKFKKLFDKGKKKGAAEACKNFDKSKESIDKEIGEKTPDLHPKVVEIYRSSTIITKKLLKEPSEPAVKDNSDAVKTVLQELSKAGFPGAQMLTEAESKFGSAFLPGPIVYLFEKTSTFLVEEPLPEVKEETREIAVEDIKAEAAAEEPPKEEEKKEEEKLEEAKEEEKKEEEVKVEEKKEEVKVEEKIEEVKEEVKVEDVPPPPAPAVETAASKEALPPPPPAAEVVEKLDPPAASPEKVDPAPPPPAAAATAAAADPVAAPPPAKTES